MRALHDIPSSFTIPPPGWYGWYGARRDHYITHFNESDDPFNLPNTVVLYDPSQRPSALNFQRFNSGFQIQPNTLCKTTSTGRNFDYMPLNAPNPIYLPNGRAVYRYNRGRCQTCNAIATRRGLR